jgi:hypothetical protein
MQIEYRDDYCSSYNFESKIFDIVEEKPFFANNTEKTCNIYIFYIIHPFVAWAMLIQMEF